MRIYRIMRYAINRDVVEEIWFNRNQADDRCRQMNKESKDTFYIEEDELRDAGTLVVIAFATKLQTSRRKAYVSTIHKLIGWMNPTKEPLWDIHSSD